MTSYINKFKDKKTKIAATTMSLMVKDKNFLKLIIKHGKRLKD